MTELNPELYGFDTDSFKVELSEGLTTTGNDFINHLQHVYCGKIATEFMHLTNANERQWFAEAYEKCCAQKLSAEKKVDALKIMFQGKAWENFLATKFPTLKRYSGEGSESALALYQYLLEDAANHLIKEVTFFILNLVCIFKKFYDFIKNKKRNY